MNRVMLVFGTRPEAIKMCPLVKEFQKYPTDFETIVCVTGQHREMLDQVLRIFDVTPNIDLNIMKQGQDLTDVTVRILTGMRDVFKTCHPDVVLVHGDTTTSTAAALAAFYAQIPVGHVEAGLRTHNIYSPWPEEMNRQITGRIATYHFAPTPLSEKNLKDENAQGHIFVTGNTVIDALFCLSEDVISQAKKFYEENNIEINDKLILITAHRRENHGERIDRIINAISYLAKKYDDHIFVIPVHPNPNVKEKFYSRLSDLKNIKLLNPLDYPYLVYLMKNAKLILTDSGGIQEEAPSFACPTLVMRYETERKEGIEVGVSKLVGADYDKIITEAEKILTKDISQTRLKVKNPYGDGTTSKKIVEIIRKYFS